MSSQSFRDISKKLNLALAIILEFAKQDDWPAIVGIHQRMQKICDEAEVLLSNEKAELVQDEKQALQEVISEVQRDVQQYAVLKNALDQDLATFKHQREVFAERQDTAKRESQATLAVARAQLARETKVLEDGQATLARENKFLDDGQATLAGENKVLDDGQATLARQKKILDDDQASLAQDQESLRQAQQALQGDQTTVGEQRASLAAATEALREERRDIELARSTLASQTSAVEVDKSTLLQGRLDLAQEKMDLTQAKSDSAEERSILTAGQSALVQGNSDLAQSQLELTEAQEKLETEQSTLAKDASKLMQDKLDCEEAKSTLVAGQSTLAQDKLDLAQERMELMQAKLDFAEAKSTLVAGQSTLAQGKSDLAQSQLGLAESQRKLESEQTTLADDVSKLETGQTTLANDASKLAQDKSALAEDKAKTAEEQRSCQQGLNRRKLDLDHRERTLDIELDDRKQALVAELRRDLAVTKAALEQQGEDEVARAKEELQAAFDADVQMNATELAQTRQILDQDAARWTHILEDARVGMTDSTRAMQEAIPTMADLKKLPTKEDLDAAGKSLERVTEKAFNSAHDTAASVRLDIETRLDKMVVTMSGQSESVLDIKTKLRHLENLDSIGSIKEKLGHLESICQVNTRELEGLQLQTWEAKLTDFEGKSIKAIKSCLDSYGEADATFKQNVVGKVEDTVVDLVAAQTHVDEVMAGVRDLVADVNERLKLSDEPAGVDPEPMALDRTLWEDRVEKLAQRLRRIRFAESCDEDPQVILEAICFMHIDDSTAGRVATFCDEVKEGEWYCLSTVASYGFETIESVDDALGQFCTYHDKSCLHARIVRDVEDARVVEFRYGV